MNMNYDSSFSYIFLKTLVFTTAINELKHWLASRSNGAATIRQIWAIESIERLKTQWNKILMSTQFSIGDKEEKNLKAKWKRSTEYRKNSINVIMQLRENYDQFVSETNRVTPQSVRLFRNKTETDA